MHPYYSRDSLQVAGHLEDGWDEIFLAACARNFLLRPTDFSAVLALRMEKQ